MRSDDSVTGDPTESPDESSGMPTSEGVESETADSPSTETEPTGASADDPGTDTPIDESADDAPADDARAAFAHASAAATRAEAKSATATKRTADADTAEEPEAGSSDAAISGSPEDLDDRDPIEANDSLWTTDDEDEVGYAEVRRSSPGWAISKWILSAAVAATVVILSFIAIPRLFTPDESETAASPSAGDTSAPPTTTAAPVVSYPDLVMGSAPSHYWRFEMSAAGANSAGTGSLNVGPEAAILGSSAYAGGMGSIDCSGTGKSKAVSDTLETPSGDLSIEVWINTVTNKGGPIVTFGNKDASTSTKVNRALYMSTVGKAYFGVLGQSREYVESPKPVNNGAWRHIVGTMSATTGLALYVDGQQVASEPEGTTIGNLEGYWKVCGDTTQGWPANSGRPAFTGTVDDVAIYPKALSAKEVLDHYNAVTGT